MTAPAPGPVHTGPGAGAREVKAAKSRAKVSQPVKSLPYYLLVLPALLLSMAVVLVPGLMPAHVPFTDRNRIAAEMP